jgi:hypothetical protein
MIQNQKGNAKDKLKGNWERIALAIHNIYKVKKYAQTTIE